MEHTDASSGAAPAGKTSRGYFRKLSGFCGKHATAMLIAIVVLVVIIIVMYVYYHGVFGLGPYAENCKKSHWQARDAASKHAGGDAANDKADPETEKLIATINGQ